MRTIEFTYTDNSKETFENVTDFSFCEETNRFNVEHDGCIYYTVNYNDIMGYIDSQKK